MDAGTFERIARKSGFTPLDKHPTPLGNVLIAERYANAHPEMPEPHWQVLWGIERDGMDKGQKLYITGREMGLRTPLAVTRAERVAAAVKCATRFMKDSLDCGRYA